MEGAADTDISLSFQLLKSCEKQSNLFFFGEMQRARRLLNSVTVILVGTALCHMPGTQAG